MRSAILVLVAILGINAQLLASGDIFHAARTNDTESLIQFLNNQGNIDTISDSGYSLLLLACYYNSFDFAKLLIECNAKLDFSDRTGNTALIAASMQGIHPLVELLLHHGANVNAINHRGANALLFAVNFDHHDVTEILLKQNINVDQSDFSGRSAFDYASVSNNSSAIVSLTKNLHALR